MLEQVGRLRVSQSIHTGIVACPVPSDLRFRNLRVESGTSGVQRHAVSAVNNGQSRAVHVERPAREPIRQEMTGITLPDTTRRPDDGTAPGHTRAGRGSWGVGSAVERTEGRRDHRRDPMYSGVRHLRGLAPAARWVSHHRAAGWSRTLCQHMVFATVVSGTRAGGYPWSGKPAMSRVTCVFLIVKEYRPRGLLLQLKRNSSVNVVT